MCEEFNNILEIEVIRLCSQRMRRGYSWYLYKHHIGRWILNILMQSIVLFLS